MIHYNKVLLFDIDGTLIKCNGAGRDSLIRACIDTFGSAGIMDRVDFQGKTDSLILQEALIGTGFNENFIAPRMVELKEHYVRYLTKALRNGTGHILPGVKELLERLTSIPYILVGLLTGNFEEGAFCKLSRFGLADYFRFGVYGENVFNRNAMPQIAKELILKKFGHTIAFSDMVIIGDTVHDIACAQSVNATSFCVGTGWSDREVLLSQQPDYFFDDLSDTEHVLNTMIGNK